MQGPFNFSQTSIEQNVSDKPGVYVLLYEGKRVGQDHSDNVREKLLSIFIPAGSRRTGRPGTPVSHFLWEYVPGGSDVRRQWIEEIRTRDDWT